MQRYDVLVIGAGVAGLTAAAFVARGGLTVAVVERFTAGGQVSNVDAIDNFPGLPAGTPGYELGPLLQEQASSAGAEFVLATVNALALGQAAHVLTLDDGQALQGTAVIVAAGSSRRRLNVPGEARLWGRGVSQCASCDGPLYRGLQACVVGGGDAALSEALHLAAHAQQVTLVHRGAALRAQGSLVDRLRASRNIHTVFDTVVEEVVGDPSVNAVLLRNRITGERNALPTSGLFVFVGLEPNTGFLNGLLKLDDARIVVDMQMQTSERGIFAAGDVRAGSAALLAASAGDGATAAMAAVLHVRRNR
jgi:thioredoxin reductase (NADPH)